MTSALESNTALWVYTLFTRRTSSIRQCTLWALCTKIYGTAVD